MGETDEARGMRREAHRLAERAKQIVMKASGVLGEILDTDDDLILSEQFIIEGDTMTKSILAQKRERVAELQTKRDAALKRKESADAVLVAKRLAYEATIPKLPAGVIAAIPASRSVDDWRLMRAVKKTVISESPAGSIVIEDIEPNSPGDMRAEREAARRAHVVYHEAYQLWANASDDLINFERNLRDLRERIECLKDL